MGAASVERGASFELGETGRVILSTLDVGLRLSSSDKAEIRFINRTDDLFEVDWNDGGGLSVCQCASFWDRRTAAEHPSLTWAFKHPIVEVSLPRKGVRALTIECNGACFADGIEAEELEVQASACYARIRDTKARRASFAVQASAVSFLASRVADSLSVSVGSGRFEAANLLPADWRCYTERCLCSVRVGGRSMRAHEEVCAGDGHLLCEVDCQGGRVVIQ